MTVFQASPSQLRCIRPLGRTLRKQSRNLALFSTLAGCLLSGTSLGTVPPPPAAPLTQPAKGPIPFPLSEVKPGLKGKGWTCLKGRELSEFTFEVIGVLMNISAGHNTVLVRITGGDVLKVGVFSGMSGSPAYIGDRLLGAMAYSFPFSTDPVAGITPYEEMRAEMAPRPESPRYKGIEIKPAAMTDARALLQDLCPMPSGFESKAAAASSTGGSMKPIATPLLVSGASPAALEAFGGLFRTLGFEPMQGSGGASSASGDPSRDPAAGQGIVVSLVQGDVAVGAGGTITAVDGTRVYAFGHPFMGLGSTEMLFSDSETLLVVPNMNNSFKLFTTGAPLGVCRQDRTTGLAGELGVQPALLPVDVSVLGTGGISRSFHFAASRDPLFGPLLINFGIFSAASGEDRVSGFNTVEAVSTIKLKGGEELSFRNIFNIPSNGLSTTTTWAVAPLQYVLMSGFAGIEVDRFSVFFRILPGLRNARVEEISADRSRVRPGETVRFRVGMVRQDGNFEYEDFPLTIPEDMTPGPVQVFLGDGSSLTQLDQQLEPGRFTAYNGPQLLRLLRGLRQDGTLYLKLYRKGEGVYARGCDMPALPPSYLDIFKGKRVQGASTPIQNVHYMEKNAGNRDYVISGSRTFQLLVEPK